jgi:hypothetical protein
MDLLNFVRFAFRTVLYLPSRKKLPGRVQMATRPVSAGRLRVNFLTTQGEKLCLVETPSSAGL